MRTSRKTGCYLRWYIDTGQVTDPAHNLLVWRKVFYGEWGLLWLWQASNINSKSCTGLIAGLMCVTWQIAPSMRSSLWWPSCLNVF